MAKLLSESKVLHKLGIENFNQLTKEKSIHFASMIDKMEPEVAQKALEQFPEFAMTAKEMLSDYKDILEKGMISNDASIKAVYDTYNAIIASLQKQLENDNLSFEEKKEILEQMKDIADRVDKKDTENKKWIMGLAVVGGVVAVGVIAALAAVLGGDVSAKESESEPDKDSDEPPITNCDELPSAF